MTGDDFAQNYLKAHREFMDAHGVASRTIRHISTEIGKAICYAGYTKADALGLSGLTPWGEVVRLIANAQHAYHNLRKAWMECEEHDRRGLVEPPSEFKL